MTIALPEKVQQIIDTFYQAGFEAYAVGGCIRDSILGRRPDDWDVTTSATPQQTKALFGRTIDTGIQHGTVTVMIGKEGFEVTTYRIDGKYEDSRHPREVTFTPNLEEDLKRRDFTMNALAYNDREGLVDLFGGIEDMRRGMIRCVGEAKERFREDALRMMRAIRFSAQLGYQIEEATREAIRSLAPNLKAISAERIQVELRKLVSSDHPEYLRVAWELGVTDVILPEFTAIMNTEQNHLHHCYSVGEHTLHAMQETKKDEKLRLAVLLHDMGKPGCLTTDETGVTHFHGHAQASAELAREILRRLRFDNDTIHTVCRLVLYHDYGNGVEPDRRIVRRAMNKIGEELFPALFAVKRADILAQSETFREEKLERLARWEELYQEIVEAGECVSLKTLAVTGRDLMEAGMAPGKELGETLQYLLQQVIEQPQQNTREALLALVRKQ